MDRIEELSRMIAEHFEPDVNSQRWRENGYLSDGRFWLCDNPESNCEIRQFGWEPRSIKDPQIAMRILKELVDGEAWDAGVNLWARHQDSYDGKSVYGADVEYHDTQECESIEEAAAEALVVVLGLEKRATK